MDLSKKYEVEKMVSEKNYGTALMSLIEIIANLEKSKYTLSNGFLYWAVSQRSLCFRQLGQMSFAYEDAKNLIKEKPTEEAGYLRKSEVELQLGLHEDAVKTLSVWQYKRRGTESNDGAAARQQLKVALEKHKEAVAEEKKMKLKSLAFGAVLGLLLALWLTVKSEVVVSVVVSMPCVVLGALLSRFIVTMMQKLQNQQRRATLSDFMDDKAFT